MSDKVYLGRNMAQLDTSPALEPVSRVVLLVDDENAYTAGNNTGRTVELTCPYGTQAMANSILASLQAYAYTPLQAQDALLDPAAELGDGLTAGGVYTVLGQMDLEWDALMTSDSGAPGQAEQESEYQYRSPVIAELNYQIAETRSTISKTADEIRLEVKDELNDLSASITVRLDSITQQIKGINGQITTVEQTVSSISSTVQDQASRITKIDQKIDSISLSVSNGDSSSQLTILSNGIKLDSATISFTGMVTFSDLSGNGTTTINGSNLMTGTVFADYIKGNSVELLDDRNRTAGYITLEGASSTSAQKIYMESGAIELNALSGDIYLEANRGASSYVQISDGAITIGRGDLQSNLDGRYDCGTINNRWATVYAASSTIITSDRNQKNSITYDMSVYGKLFDLLRPTPYKYNDGTSGRTHIGLIAQDVEEALAEVGLTAKDFAGLVIGKNVDDDSVYSLRYEEFIAMCIYKIQTLNARVAELEGARL